MNVIYKYSDVTNRKIAVIDAAISCYIFYYTKMINETHMHINPTPKYVRDLLENDAQYAQLVSTRNEIINTAIPEIITIETDDGLRTFQ